MKCYCLSLTYQNQKKKKSNFVQTYNVFVIKEYFAVGISVV